MNLMRLTAKEFYDLDVRPEYAYIDLSGSMYDGLNLIKDIDSNMTGTEFYVAFEDALGGVDCVNATNKDILVDDYDG